MPEQIPERSGIQVTIRDYLQIFFRRRWHFFLPLMIVFFTVTVVSFFLPKVYRATAVIMVEEPETVNPLAPPVRGPTMQPPPIEEQLLVFREQLLSWPYIFELIRRLKLAEGITTEVELEELMEEIWEEFGVEVAARNIYEVSFEDRDPVKSQSVVNNLVQIFIEDNLRRRRQDLSTAVDFIGEQMRMYQKRLEDSDRELYEFKEKNLLNFPGIEENINIQQLARYEASLYELELNLSEVEYQRQLLERQLSGEEKVVVTEAMRGINPIVDELYKQLTGLEMELTVLLTEATEKHPRVIELRSHITRTQERLNRAVKQTLSKDTAEVNPVYQRMEQKFKEIELTIDQIKSRKAEMENIVAEYRQRVELVPEAERQLARLTRDSRGNESIYAMLKERWESNRISQVEVKERGVQYRILAPARLPLKPAKPNKPLLSLMGLILGILLGFGFVFLAEFSDHSFHRLEDARTFLDLPVLAAVPAVLTPAEIETRQSQRRFLFLLMAAFAIMFIIGLVIGLIRAGY